MTGSPLMLMTAGASSVAAEDIRIQKLFLLLTFWHLHIVSIHKIELE